MSAEMVQKYRKGHSICGSIARIRIPSHYKIVLSIMSVFYQLITRVIVRWNGAFHSYPGIWETVARRPCDEDCTTGHRLRWDPLPPRDVGMIAHHVRGGEKERRKGQAWIRVINCCFRNEGIVEPSPPHSLPFWAQIFASGSCFQIPLAWIPPLM